MLNKESQESGKEIIEKKLTEMNEPFTLLGSLKKKSISNQIDANIYTPYNFMAIFYNKVGFNSLTRYWIGG